MANEPKPAAIRIMRPYASDEELLANEPETLTRTTVVLLGAQPKPQGVILRFEVTLATGEPLLRGEGRVVQFRPATDTAESGLTLRFTRLDARSKALVDRAAAMRDARAPRISTPPPPAPAPPLPPPPRLPDPPPLSRRPAATLSSPPMVETSSAQLAPLGQTVPSPARATLPTHAAGGRELPALAAENRQELLARLRERAAQLPPERVREIVARRSG